MTDSGWWKGTVDNRTGVFPHTYVEFRTKRGGAPAAEAGPSSAASAAQPASWALDAAAAAAGGDSSASRERANSFNPFLVDEEEEDDDDAISAAAAALFAGGGDAATPASPPTKPQPEAAAAPVEPPAAQSQTLQDALENVPDDDFGWGPDGTPSPAPEAAAAADSGPPETVSDWLASINMSGELSKFLGSGYDNLGFLPLVSLLAMGAHFFVCYVRALGVCLCALPAIGVAVPCAGQLPVLMRGAVSRLA